MREILFRGKQKSNGNWVHGDLSYHRDGRMFIRCWDRLGFDTTYNAYEVNPETGGQFTGLYDSTKWEDLPDAEKLDFYKKHYIGSDGMSVRFQHIDDVKHLWKGKKIFEGDIVAYCWYEDEPMNFQIEFVSGEFIAVPVKKREGVWAIRISGQGENLEIVGNIHDNPELLNGGAEDGV